MNYIHASLFSGIGGPEVAAAMMGWKNAFHCEINPFGRAVLDYWFPESKSYEDITKTDFREWRGKIDILTAGFPCQPFSFAGKRGGDSDERYLWPEAFRVIDEVRPTWFVGENVAGIATMVEAGVLTPMGWEGSLFGEVDGVHRYGYRGTFTIERICRDLEEIGYSVQPMLIPAAAIGAPHRRDRIFFLAHNDADTEKLFGDGGIAEYEGKFRGKSRPESGDSGRSDASSDTTDIGLPGAADARAEGEVCEEVDGEGNNAERGIPASTASRGGSSSDSNSRRLERASERRGERAGDDAMRRGGIGCEETSSDTLRRGSGEVSPEVHAGFADGAEPFSDGSKLDASHADGARREEPKQPGREKDSTEDGAGVHDRTERPCRNGQPADTIREGLERTDESGESKGGKRMRVRRDFAGHDRSDLLPENRWADFPTVSPVHAGNDGLPFRMDGASIPFTKWRTEAIKAYGNAIVPQVMYRIFQAIQGAK